MKKYPEIDVNAREDKGVKLFMDGHNCAQSVVCAFADLYGLDNELAMRLSSSFGAGLGRQRLTCGAVSGMCMLAGLETGTSETDPVKRGVNYTVVKNLCNQFRELNSSIICGELLGLKKAQRESTVPSERNAEYYAKRPCARMVGSACRIFATYLSEIEED